MVGFHCQARCDHHSWRQCSLYSLNLQLDNGGGSSHPCLIAWIALRVDSQTTHNSIPTYSLSLPQKVKCEAQTGTCQWWISTLKNSCGCTALDMPEWKEMTEHVCCGQSNHWKWLASQKSEVFRSVKHYLQAQCQGHQTIGHPEERCGKRKRSTIFLERTKKGYHESDEHWNHCKGNVGEASERQGGTHVSFSKCIDTILNWTDTIWNRMTSRVLMHNQQGQVLPWKKQKFVFFKFVCTIMYFIHSANTSAWSNTP